MSPLDMPSMKTMLLCSLCMGGITSFIAHRYRNRKPLSWFIFGFCFGCLALIALFLLPKLQKEKLALATDSLAIPASTPVYESPQELWYFLQEDKQIGPISFARLQNYYLEGLLKPSSYVWNETLSDWKKLEELPQQLQALEESSSLDKTTS